MKNKKRSRGVLGYHFDIIIIIVNVVAQHSADIKKGKEVEDTKKVLEKCAEAADDALQLQKALAHLLFVICFFFFFPI
jgi:hypothetical protein